MALIYLVSRASSTSQLEVTLIIRFWIAKNLIVLWMKWIKIGLETEKTSPFALLNLIT